MEGAQGQGQSTRAARDEHERAVRDVAAQLQALLPQLEQIRESMGLANFLRQDLIMGLGLASQARIAGDLSKTVSPLNSFISAHLDSIRQNLSQLVPDALAVHSDQVTLAAAAGLAQLAAVVPSRLEPVTSTGSVSLGSMKARGVGEVGAAAEQLTVETEATDSAAGRFQIDQATLIVILVWVWALSMPAAQELLPQEVKDYLNALWATVALALAVQWRINDKRKR